MSTAPPTAALPNYNEAIERAKVGVKRLSRTELVPLSNCLDRVLATPVNADRDLPPFNRSALDGYAVKASAFSNDRTWPVVATIAAGSQQSPTVESDCCVAIATGAPLPAGLDAVIPHERSDRGDRQGNPVTFSVRSIEAGQGVHKQGADAHTGDTIITPYSTMSAHHIGLAATVGSNQLEVMSHPRATVITTGDELVATGTNPAAHQIRNSNGPQTSALLHQMGAQVLAHEHYLDDFDVVHAGLAQATSNCDLVVTVGGISAGDRDHVPGVLEKLGMKTLVKGCAMQPGRPVLIGLCDQALVVGLPGNPVSALVCSTLFIWPLIRRMLGLDTQLPWRKVRLNAPVQPNAKRQAFRPAQVTGDTAHVPQWAGSGDLSHTSKTNGVVALPMQGEPLTNGSEVPFVPWPSRR